MFANFWSYIHLCHSCTLEAGVANYYSIFTSSTCSHDVHVVMYTQILKQEVPWHSGLHAWLGMWRLWVWAPFKAPVVSFGRETFQLLLSTGWFQERIRAWFHNQTKIKGAPYGRLTSMSNKPPTLNIVKTTQLHVCSIYIDTCLSAGYVSLWHNNCWWLKRHIMKISTIL